MTRTFAIIFLALAAAAPVRASSLFHHAARLTASLQCDPRLARAAEIAVKRANPHPTLRCWHYVKDALVEAGAVASRPSSPWARQAGDELCAKYGFQRLNIRNPLKAPVGAVIVYGGPDAGHVEFRTASGFASDFISTTPYPRPLVGIYAKPA